MSLLLSAALSKWHHQNLSLIPQFALFSSKGRILLVDKGLLRASAQTIASKKFKFVKHSDSEDCCVKKHYKILTLIK